MHLIRDDCPVIENRTRVTYGSENKQADDRPQNVIYNCNESRKADVSS